MSLYLKNSKPFVPRSTQPSDQEWDCLKKYWNQLCICPCGWTGYYFETAFACGSEAGYCPIDHVAIHHVL